MIRVLSCMLKTVALALFIVLVAPASGWALISDTLKLNKQDTTDLMRIQRHLNSAKTIRARFLQISSNGEYSEGEIALQRPGRLKLTYDSPNPLMVVADGTYISYVDRELEQATTLPLKITRAELLLRASMSFFGKDVIVTGFERSPGALRVSLVKTDEALEGNITLIFSDNPLEIRKWTVTDAQGITTTVSLLGPIFNAPLNPELFHYMPSDKTDQTN